MQTCNKLIALALAVRPPAMFGVLLTYLLHPKSIYYKSKPNWSGFVVLNLKQTRRVSDVNTLADPAEGNYNEWIVKSQSKRSEAHNERLGLGGDMARLTLASKPPAFDSDTIFKATVEDYAS